MLLNVYINSLAERSQEIEHIQKRCCKKTIAANSYGSWVFLNDHNALIYFNK